MRVRIVLLCVLFIGAVVGFVIRVVRYSKALPASVAASASEVSALATSAPQVASGPLHRECPYCKEAIRRDASVCPHCRRESAAWQYEGGRWLTTGPDGVRAWLDEDSQAWQSAGFAWVEPQKDDTAPTT